MARVDVYKVHRPKLTQNVIKLDILKVIWIKGVWSNYFKFMYKIHIQLVAYSFEICI